MMGGGEWGWVGRVGGGELDTDIYIGVYMCTFTPLKPWSLKFIP